MKPVEGERTGPVPGEGARSEQVTGRRRLIGLTLGLAAFVAILSSPPPEGLNVAGWRVAAVAALMAIWWVSEALPVAATALLPLALFPLLTVAPIEKAAAPYANPLIFLFMGGFIIALAIERWDLHRRVALGVLYWVGARQDRLIAGFMLVTAFLSMWVSNTATTVMMLPIGLSVINLLQAGGAHSFGRPGFQVALLLAIAYAASIGGMATLIGTPPNALLAGFMSQVYGVPIGFGQWMLVGLPLAALMLVPCWFLLSRVLFPVSREELPGARETIHQSLRAMGTPSRAEKLVAGVFLVTAALWIARPYLEQRLPAAVLSDAGIAILGALALFVIPVLPRQGVFLMNWEWARRLPWGVLLLFGGGLSLASAVSSTGLAEWIGAALSGLAAWPTLALVLTVTGLIVFLTELTSNTATAATFLPVVAALAVTLGESPFLLAAPAALAASCAFMMPVATPPNAIVFGSGHVTIAQMVRAGFWLNVVGIVVITATAYTLMGIVFDVGPGIPTAPARGDSG